MDYRRMDGQMDAWIQCQVGELEGGWVSGKMDEKGVRVRTDE
jgi:hypothetical protein